MLGYLGKLLIVVSLCFQGYILLERQTVADEFNNKLLAALDKCDCLPDHIAGYILFYGRFVVVGLLGSSVLMLLSRCWTMKILPLMALIGLLYLEHQHFTKTPCIECVSFWNKISQIGALIYLMGVDDMKITQKTLKIDQDVEKNEKLKAKRQ